ncbi:MAG: PAS domain S-box protein [Burkholderiales bacterium]|nr:PAS domain S-box protein [Burkholderiales bacterium]
MRPAPAFATERVPAELLDEISDALLWVRSTGAGDAALLVGANAAARRMLPVAVGRPVRNTLAALGPALPRWLALQGRERSQALLEGTDGATVRAEQWTSGGLRVLRLHLLAAPLATRIVESGDGPAPDAAQAELLRMLWASPFPALLHDAAHRIVDANEAFVAFSGHERAALLGRDVAELSAPEEQELFIAARQALGDAPRPGSVASLPERRLLHADGAERWCRSVLYPVQGSRDEHGSGGEQGVLRLELLQDSTAEHVARAHAERSLTELGQWFDLSPMGMLVFDHGGLIVRSNPAFERLVERVPVLLADADAELQMLLAWEGRAPAPELTSSQAPLERQVLVCLDGGRLRRLGARLSSFATRGGQRRYMAVVEDRSAEEERDLAQLEMGALMHTASVGVATYDPARGWLAAQRKPGAGGGRAAGGALLGIGRELVEPDSLPEYERLQQALRRGERVEVRYAVRHPELGPRWLLTRVEPGVLGSDRPTSSVVTLDVTDQEQAQRRNEQLLRELSTIMDSSTAGIAYLRGALLVRCNHRFERMLGLLAGSAAGASFESLFAALPLARRVVRDAAAALAAGEPFEAEMPVGESAGSPVWYSLSLRAAQDADGGAEAVAVLTDVSRLKAQQAELERLLRERELMFSLSEVGIVYLRGRRIERANQAMAALTGYAAPELTALDGSELHADVRDCVEFETELARALQQQGRYAAERRLRRRDGSLLWVQVAARPVDAADPGAGVICSYVDIDERHRARESLAGQAMRTRALLDSVLVGIVTVGEHGIEWMNRSARRMFGGELADFVGEAISIVATPAPDHPLRHLDAFARLREGQSETFECRLKARDGREFWVVGNAVVTGQGGEGERQLTFALLDIERRRQAEISIAQAQASLQRMIETAPLAIALFDARSLRLLQLNQMASTFFGRPVVRMAGRTLAECLPHETAAQLTQWLLDGDGQTSAQQHEWRAQGEGGASRVWDVRVVWLDPGAEAAPQLLLVASDVSVQREAEQARLQAAIAQREVLVREVHHRIKNNLQGVAGLLQQHAQRDPAVGPMLTEAVGQVQAIAQVYGLQVGAGGPLRVADVLGAIAASVQRTFGRTIEVQASDEARHWLMPEADSIPVALTLNELLTNAIKHGHGPSVRCQAGVDGDRVLVTIANAGRLPPGFDLARFPGALSGLGLARALLPRRSAGLSLQQQDDEVVARVELRAPCVQRDPGAAAAERLLEAHAAQ